MVIVGFRLAIVLSMGSGPGDGSYLTEELFVIPSGVILLGLIVYVVLPMVSDSTGFEQNINVTLNTDIEE